MQKTTGRQLRTGAAVLGLASLVALTGCSRAAAQSDFEVIPSTGSGAPIELSSEEWDAMVEAANTEGELTIYSGQPASEDAFAQFSETYPEIDLTVLREPAGDLAIRMDQEIQAGVAGADVSWSTQYAWNARQGDAGTLAAFRYSPENATAGWSDVTHEDYFMQLLASPYVLAWHTELGSPVTDIQDLIEKADNQPVGIAEPISQNGMHQLNAWVESHGEGILEDLAGLNHNIIRSTQPLTQSLAAGETHYSVLTTPDVVESLMDEDAPIDYVVPESDATGFAYGPSILADAAHPAAAQVFLNWLISEEGQQTLAEDLRPAAFPVLYDSTEGALDWDAIDAVDERDWPEDRRNEFRALFDSYFVG